MMAAEKMKK